MPIIRVNKHTKDYVVIDRTCLNDMRLSFKARGLAAYLLTKPDQWQINLEHLSKVSEQDGKEAVRTGLKELVDKGYMYKEKARNDKGHFKGWERELYEKPSLNPHYKGDEPRLDYPKSEKPKSDKPTSENRTQGCNELEVSNENEVSNEDSSSSDKSDQDKFSITKKENGLYDYPDGFEKVWSAYPASRGTKKAAWRKWAARRREGIENELMLQAAENYAKETEVHGTDKKFIKHAKTFFGPDEYWREYIDENFEDDQQESSGGVFEHFEVVN